MHNLDRQQLEYPPSQANGAASELSEAQELELAAELLEVSSEEELENWLATVASQAGRALTSAQRAAGKAYTANAPAVDRTIRVVGTVGPPVTAALLIRAGVPPDLAMLRARQMASQIGFAGDWLKRSMPQWSKLELEGLSSEDRELEYARRYTRFAHRALRNAWQAPRGMRPARAAWLAVRHAARRDLPGLVPQLTQIFHIGANELPTAGAGRWRRARNAIVIDLG
jgi:hypothetical protein